MKGVYWIAAIVVLCGIVGKFAMNKKKDSLRTYAEKRDFKKTPEPPAAHSVKTTTKSAFVIQKHEASHVHYDFRLEIDGVLASWAVPKGPSLNPEEKRLAVRTEDHPFAYKDFEGVIPEGNYGSGTVMIWDYGTYENIKIIDGKTMSMEECLKKGQIEIFLHGKKLEGGYALIRTHYHNSDKNWLLIKMDDEYADKRKNPVSMQNKSAKSGKTMHQIEKEGVIYED